MSEFKEMSDRASRARTDMFRREQFRDLVRRVDGLEGRLGELEAGVRALSHAASAPDPLEESTMRCGVYTYQPDMGDR